MAPFDPKEFLKSYSDEKAAEPVRTWGDTAADVAAAAPQVSSDMLRIGANSATYGQWERARAVADVLTGGAPSYAEALQLNVDRTRQARERLGGFASGTADALGGLATGATWSKAGGMVAGSAADMARPLWQRMITGGVEGAAHGAAQATGHTYSDNPADYIKPAVGGALLGGGLGAGVPAAGTAAASVANVLWPASKLRGTGQVIPGNLARAADADRAGLDDLMRGRYGPRGMLPDTGPSMLGAAQGAVMPDKGDSAGKSLLINRLRSRNETSAPTIVGETDRILGPTREPSAIQAEVTANMQRTGREYDPLLQNARAIDTQGIANQLRGRSGEVAGERLGVVQQALRDLEIPGNPGVLDPHPRRIQAVRSAIGDRIRDPATPPATREELERVHGLLTNELQLRVPGIRELDSRYAELGTQQRGADYHSAGGSIFDTGQTQVIRPHDYREIFREGVQPKGTNIGPSAEPFRFSQAARAEIDRIIGTKGDDLRALENVLGRPHDWNAQKLAQTFGQERADQLMNVLRNERQFRDTYQKVVENAQTAFRLKAAEAQDAPKAAPGFYTRLEQAAIGGYNKLIEKQAEKTRDNIARIMATNDPNTLRTIIPQILAVEPNNRARAAIINELVTSRGMGGATGLAAGEGYDSRKRKPTLPPSF